MSHFQADREAARPPEYSGRRGNTSRPDFHHASHPFMLKRCRPSSRQ